MTRSSYQNQKRREREEALELERQAEYEAQLQKDSTPIEWIINEVSSWADVQYVLHRIAKHAGMED
jgi:hypothetical protein